MIEPKFEAAVGMSRKWEAREAGREVARNTIEKLSRPPNFFLLFSTIHYEKHGGFQEFLNGVWDVLPKGTPLVGGTVAGFINPEGCYTRGATGLAVTYSNIKVAVGIGRNTGRWPKLAGRKCAKKIQDELKKTNYRNLLCIDFISGVTMPTIPGMPRIVVLKNRILAQMSLALLKISTIVFQKGVAREENVLKELLNALGNNTYVFGGSTVDNNVFARSYQFFNDKVVKNSIVTLAIATDKRPQIRSAHGFELTDQKFKKIKLTAWNRMIKKIDGEPAVKKYLDTLNWSEDLIDERTFHRRLIFNPLGAKDEEGFIHPFVPGAFLGNDYVTGCPIVNDEVGILKASGLNLISAVTQVVDQINQNEDFFLFTSCASRLETLGANEFQTQKIISEKIKKPFLLVYTTGENYYLPGKTIKNLEITFNSLSLS